MDVDQAKMLRRRIYCLRLHIQYLEDLAVDPTSIEAEVFRRYEAIAQHKEEIAAHLKRISALMDLSSNVQEYLPQAEAKLRSLKRSLDKLNLDEYIKEYHAINKKLKEL